MLEIEEDTQYGLAKEALLMQLRSMTTLLSHARARMENNFGFFFFDQTKLVVIKTFIDTYKNTYDEGDFIIFKSKTILLKHYVVLLYH